MIALDTEDFDAKVGVSSWFCARTKPKHEHVAAASVRRNLGLEVFHPCLRIQKMTRRGLVRTVEALFPCYIFVRCNLGRYQSEIQYARGVSSLVNFGGRVPNVPDSVVEELQQHFSGHQPLVVDDPLTAGAEVVVTGGAFTGMHAMVLQVLPARRRVQLLLDILGRPTTVEADRVSVVLDRNAVVDWVPLLAVSKRKSLHV